jgi:membrane glycosyltransferase
MTLRLRRLVVAALVVGTCAGLSVAFWTVLSTGGVSAPEIVMFACFLASLPWLVLGFWNGIIGFALLRFSRDPLMAVTPCARQARAFDPIEGRTAIVMCIRHEDPDRVVRRLEAIRRSLDATAYGDMFDIFVLSDSARPEMVARETAAIGEWRDGLASPERVIYRRRADNSGFKAGNLREFVLRWGDRYETMITLDADSVMSGEAILRLIRIMQANPRLGILQSLVVGLPARTIFARTFQFGMRAGMRSYAMGAAWWSGDWGPYWGHNAAIRIAPFREHCELPILPGRPPLGGVILSHDQVEAVLMRTAGYEVRVLPEEGGSWEENPATLPEFLRRNLRWCQGNMQYLKLLRRPGLPLLGRIQLLLAILMYAGAPAWVGFMIAAAVQAWDPPAVLAGTDPAEPFPWALSVGLFIAMMTLVFTPKIAGYLDVALKPNEARRYGGLGAFSRGVATELSFGLLFAPLVSFSIAAFLLRMFLFGGGIGWDAQDREGRRIAWSEAARLTWPATAFGAALGLSLALSAPQVLLWAAPVLASFLFAIPFTVLTSADAAEGASAARLSAVPEETHPPVEVRAVSDGLAAVAPYAAPLSPFRLDGGEPALRAIEDAAS